MKIFHILLRSAGIVGLAVGIYLIVQRLLQIPGNKKIDRIYSDKKINDTGNKKTKIALVIFSVLLFLVITLLLWMV